MIDVQLESGKRGHGRKQNSELKFDDETIARGEELVLELNAREADVNFTKMELGELADGLKPIYGEETLAKFAEVIEISADDLNRYRSVYRAYRDKKIKGPTPNFAVFQTLQGHPEREQIINDSQYRKRKMTVREARTLMRDYRLGQGQEPKQGQEQEQEQDPDKEQEQPEEQEAEGQHQDQNKEQDKGQKQDQDKDPNWAVTEMRRSLDEVTSFARTAWSKYGKLSKQHINHDVLRQAVDDVDMLLGTLRQGGRAFDDYADVVESILRPPAEPREPMF